MQIPSIGNQISTEIHAQFSNMIAIQNLQQYLKYLILATSIESKSTATPHEMLSEEIEQALQVSADKGIDLPSSEEQPQFSTAISQKSFSVSSFEKTADNRPKSQKLSRLTL